MAAVDVVWKKVKKGRSKECWPWLGYISTGKRTGISGGYGRLDIDGVAGVYAHRAAYLSANPGSITLGARDGIMVLHKCDNPICCNPKHLFLGTHDDNMADKKAKGRAPHYESTKSPRAKLTADDVFWMRIQKRYGATKKSLAMLYEVSEATVSGACYGRHYRDIS